jgi:hypothetical protein
LLLGGGLVLPIACAPDVDTQSAPAVEEDHADPGPGRWHPVREGFPAEQQALIEQLEAIGYASGSARSDARGVTVHDPDRTRAGLNFYTSGHGPEAILMDMDGNEIHRWRHDFDEVWPGRSSKRQTQWWRRAHLFENGAVLVMYADWGLVKLDRNSNLIWANPIAAHHDFDVTEDGEIFVLSREAGLVPRVNRGEPILEDFISVLDPDGKEKRRISLIEAFDKSEFKKIWVDAKSWRGDIFHTNSLVVLDGRLAPRVPAFRKGNVLTSMLRLDAIAVVDLEQPKVAWALQHDFKRQHDPQPLKNGNLLVFDNAGRPGRSSVMEIDPVTREVIWLYRGTPERPFYSFTCGTSERLPNENTLIVESDQGRAFEVTPEHEIVWEFHNPHRAGENDEFIATLFDLERLPPDFPTDWLPENARGATGASARGIPAAGRTTR